jgi:fibronectin-binding autotransporter adhesin
MLRKALLFGFLLLLTQVGFADTYYWAHWTSQSANSVSGTITLPDATVINVTYTGPYYFTQLNENPGSTAWWNYTPATYTGGNVDNGPGTNTDIIAIGAGARLDTLTFSTAVANPVMTIMSLNGPGFVFDQDFSVLNSGCGYWGCATLLDNATNHLVSQNGGEGHGIIQFGPSVSSISWNEDGAENWRGFTVGIAGPAAPAVPEPASIVCMLTGALGLARKLKARRG